jgi:hypothetical protein
MRHRDDEPRRIIHIGPDQDPADWSDDDGDDAPSFLIEEARERVRRREQADKESVQLARRLVFAFVAVVLLAVVFHVALPAFGLYLPPIVPILCYVAIAAGAILTARDGAR